MVNPGYRKRTIFLLVALLVVRFWFGQTFEFSGQEAYLWLQGHGEHHQPRLLGARALCSHPHPHRHRVLRRYRARRALAGSGDLHDDRFHSLLPRAALVQRARGFLDGRALRGHSHVRVEALLHDRGDGEHRPDGDRALRLQPGHRNRSRLVVAARRHGLRAGVARGVDQCVVARRPRALFRRGAGSPPTRA